MISICSAFKYHKIFQVCVSFTFNSSCSKDFTKDGIWNILDSRYVGGGGLAVDVGKYEGKWKGDIFYDFYL